MKKDSVISSYKGVKEDELAIVAGKILGAMTENANFVDPVPSVEELKLVVEDYRNKQEIAVNGGSSLDKRLKDESKKALRYQLHQLAHYVNTVADGNLAILTSSGMILAKQPSDSQVPFVIDHVTLGDGNLSGQIRVDFAPQKSIWDYEMQIGDWPSGADGVVWKESYTTTNSKGNIIASLTPGTRYYVHVRARNRKGTGDWSEHVSLIAR